MGQICRTESSFASTSGKVKLGRPKLKIWPNDRGDCRNVFQSNSDHRDYTIVQNGIIAGFVHLF